MAISDGVIQPRYEALEAEYPNLYYISDRKGVPVTENRQDKASGTERPNLTCE